MQHRQRGHDRLELAFLQLDGLLALGALDADVEVLGQRALEPVAAGVALQRQQFLKNS